MKFALKSLVAAAAIASVGYANAAAITIDKDASGVIGTTAVRFDGGQGTLAFSSGSGFDGTDPNTLGGLIGALNVGKVTVTGVGGATVQEGTLPDEFGDEIRTSSAATAQVVAVTTDDVTGQVLSVTSTGGAEQFGSRISGTLTGGTASVTNLRFDLANSLVYADLVGTKAAVGTNPAVNYNLPNQALWTIGNVSGPTTISPASLALVGQAQIDAFVAAGYTYDGLVNGFNIYSATNVISGLEVTPEGFDFFRNSLGLLSTGVNALAAVNNDAQGWGTVDSKLTFAVAAVPEPSTYAMLGVGLLVVGGALRARRRAQ